MKTLRLPFGLSGVVGLGCAAWAVCLVLGLAGGVRAQQYGQTTDVSVTFYDFHSDRSNPEFEQPHGKVNGNGNEARTGMVAQNLDSDEKPVASSSGAYLNNGVRFWFRDNSKLTNTTLYKQRTDPNGTVYPTGRDYLTKFRPIYMYNDDGNTAPPGVRIAATNGINGGEWDAVVKYKGNAYSNSEVLSLRGGKDNSNNSIDDAFKNTVIPGTLVFQLSTIQSEARNGVYKFEHDNFFPLKSGITTWTGSGNGTKIGSVKFDTPPNVLSGAKWWTSQGEKDDNFAFTMELKTQFHMKDGLTFNFKGDDDVWLFINKKLVPAVDVGGIHTAVEKSVSLNSLKGTHTLVDGQVYDMHLFYCERHANDSKIRITTNIVSIPPSRIKLNLVGGDIKAGVDKLVHATVGSDTGDVKNPTGNFEWIVTDLGPAKNGQNPPNTIGGANPTLILKPARPGNTLNKSDSINVYAEKAYTYVKVNGCYIQGEVRICADTTLWVGPGDPDRVWIEASQDSIDANLRTPRPIGVIRIEQETYVDNFYGIVRDKFGNWVRRAATTNAGGTALSGTSMLWNTKTATIATADVAAGNGNFTGPTATNISRASRGQGRADRVTTGEGRTDLYAKYIMPNFNSIKQDTAEIVVGSIKYTDIRIVVKQGKDNTSVPVTSGKDQPTGTISMIVGADTTIYAEFYDPVNKKWVPGNVTWTNVGNSVPGATAPTGTPSYWTVKPNAPTTAAGGGTITATNPNGDLTVQVKIVAVNKDPASTWIFTTRGNPDFSKDVSSYLPPAALPKAQPYVRPENFVTVTAGVNLPLVSKIFTEAIPSASTLLDESFSASAWVWTFVNGAPGTGTALSATTGDSVAFKSTVAHQQYRVRVVFTKKGKTPVQQEVIIFVVPDIRTATVTIENEWQMTTANANKPLKVPELAFASNDTTKSVYAILRDQYGNYIAPSGAEIPAAYGVPPTVKKPDWTPKQPTTGIVYAENGQITQGQGNVTRTFNTGEGVWVVVTDNTYNKKDSVKARLLNYYYDSIMIVQKCPSSNIGVSGLCSIPPTGINLTTDDTTTLFVVGRCSDGKCDGGSASGWELVPGDWDRDDGLTNALTTPPNGSNNWPLRPGSTGSGKVTVTRPGPGGTDLTADIPVNITAGAPTRAELVILTPADQRIAGQPIEFEVKYFNSLGEMKVWNNNWVNNEANFADVLAGLGLTNVSPIIVSDEKGKQDLYYKGNLGAGKVNAKLSHDLATGKDIVTITIYNATDNPHQILYTETVSNKVLVAESERFTVLPGTPSKIVIVDNTGKPVPDSVKIRYNDPEIVWRTVAEDPWGNKIGDYPSDWRADNPVEVNKPDRPIIVYVPGDAQENGCGWLVVTGSENKNLKDSLYICVEGRMEMPQYAITRDYDGCGYLDRIDLKFHKPIYFKNKTEEPKKGSDASNFISVKYDKFEWTVDSVKVYPTKDSSVSVWLRDKVGDKAHSGDLQTDWLPTITIKKGFLYTDKSEDKDICGTNANQTVKAIDGAAPVIQTAKLFASDNYIEVRFSEKVKPPSKTTFGTDAQVLNKEYPPKDLFNIWIRGEQSKALQARSRSLFKSAEYESGLSDINNLRFNPNPLEDIVGIYPKDEYTLKFYLKSGKVGPPNDYINIRTSDQKTNPVDQTKVVDKSASNVPLANNRKVALTYGDEPNGSMKAIPNPASPSDKHVDAGKINATHDDKAVAGIKNGDWGGTVFEVTLYVPGAKDANGNPIDPSKQPKVKCQLKVYDLAGNLVISGKNDDAMGGSSGGEFTKLHLYWNGYNSKKMKVAPGTYRMVVLISYTNTGNLSKDEKEFAKDKKYTGLVGISK